MTDTSWWVLGMSVSACLNGRYTRDGTPLTPQENVCNRILELDNGKCFMHDFGGSGAYQMFKEVRRYSERGQGGTWEVP